MIGVIRGTGSCVPERILTNAGIAGLVETSDGWIRERTGIEERRVVTTETCASLAAEAAKPTPKISLTPQEVSMMEYVVEREVRGGSYAHKIAVANVIVNRVLASRFPGTVSEVLHAPKQFPISIQNYYNPKWHPSDETINAVYAAVYEPDTTGGALYFYAPQYTAAKTASWFENSLTFCFEMEGHRFFAAVRWPDGHTALPR